MVTTPNGLSRRTLLAILGSAAVTAPLLSACGGNDGGTGGGSGGSGGSGGLSQWFHQYGEEGVEDAVKKWAAAYTASKITVNWVLGDYAPKLQSRLTAGSGVDLFENNAIDVASARAGQYADLTDIMEPVKAQFSETSLKVVTIDGKIYGIPMISDPQLIFYRPSMLQKAGIAEPKTFDDLIAAGIELTGGNQKGLWLGNDGGAGVIKSAAAASGGGLLSDGDTKVNFATADVASALTKLKEANDKQAVLLGSPTDWWDATSFNAGLAAITWQGMWAVPTMVKALGDDVAAMPVPAFGSGKPVVMVSGWNMQVAAKASDVDAAKAAAKAQWIDDTKFQTSFSVDFGFHIPPQTSVASATTQLGSGPAKTCVDAATQYGYAAGPFWTPAMETAFNDAAVKIITSGADATSTLQAAAQTAQQTLDSLAK
ncbi:ABC transporter substrate-binding protein [Quadrisphaera setariae]|nr:extracellular solute-binding protein [Quadrisphaera setariae]